jgi:hypothetical protein
MSMKLGTVVNIRISPANCMAIYDALLLAGIDPANYTFSSGASRVLDMLLDALRRDKLIPTRDGYEYTEIMKSFVPKMKNNMPSPTLGKAEHSQSISVSQGPVVKSSEQRSAILRFKELMIKKEHAPDSWTAEDEQELDRVYQQMG